MSLPELHNHAEDIWTLPKESSWALNMKLRLTALLMSSIGMRGEVKFYESPSSKTQELNNEFYEQTDEVVRKTRILKNWFSNVLSQERTDIIGHEVRSAIDMAVAINIALSLAENINSNMQHYAESQGVEYAFTPVDAAKFKANRERAIFFISEFSKHEGYDCIRTDYYNNVL